MDFKHDAGWKKTKPRGVEGDNLLTVVEMFAATVADIIEDQMKRGLWEYTKNPTTEVREHIGMYKQSFRVKYVVTLSDIGRCVYKTGLRKYEL